MIVRGENVKMSGFSESVVFVRNNHSKIKRFFFDIMLIKASCTVFLLIKFLFPFRVSH